MPNRQEILLRNDEQLILNLYGIGTLNIEVSRDGRCFITGPLLRPMTRQVFELSSLSGWQESTQKERDKTMQE